MAIYSDLFEIKRILQVDPNNHNEDVQLSLYNEWAGSILEEILDRDFTYKVRTVVYPGTGTQKLNLRHRPVYPTAAPSKASSLPFTALRVVVDENANYGFAPGAFSGTALTLGDGYTIRIDQDDGGSRQAILYRVNDCWPRPFVRNQGQLSAYVGTSLGSVQVTSTAGYTVDTLPAMFRMAADLIIVRLAYILPLGMQTSSESYIDRSIALSEDNRHYLINLARPFIWNYRNWKF